MVELSLWNFLLVHEPLALSYRVPGIELVNQQL